MKNLFRLMLIACLALPFAACKKGRGACRGGGRRRHADRPPTSRAGRPTWATSSPATWTASLNAALRLPVPPGESAADFQDAPYDSLLDKAKSDVARGIIAGNMMVSAAPISARRPPDLVTAAFKGRAAGHDEGRESVVHRHAADGERVKAAVDCLGRDRVFVEAK